VPADMKISFRNKVSELGQKGSQLETQVLRDAGGTLADAIAANINRSKTSSATYDHLADNIVVSRTKTNAFGERYVQVGAIKELGYRLKFLEFGTSKMNARAPMAKGVAQSKDAVARILADGQKRILKL